MKIKTIVLQGKSKEVTFLVGTCAQDNFDAIDISQPDDIWFHVKDFSSCHVIARVSCTASVYKGDRELSGDNLLSQDNAKMPEGEKLDKKIMRHIIKQGALLCKQESKYRAVKNLEIIYTKLKNVQKTNIVGSVIANPVSTIFV